METGVLNMRWTWVMDEQGNPPEGKRTPFEVPEDMIQT